jgi:hypothetical protein
VLNTAAAPNNPTDASAKNSLRDFAMLPPLRLCVVALVPHSSNITRLGIAKARAAAQRSRRAGFCKHGFPVPARKSFLFCFHAIASFLNLVHCG